LALICERLVLHRAAALSRSPLAAILFVLLRAEFEEQARVFLEEYLIAGKFVFVSHLGGELGFRHRLRLGDLACVRVCFCVCVCVRV
jgi:hypothetical protein